MLSFKIYVPFLLITYLLVSCNSFQHALTLTPSLPTALPSSPTVTSQPTLAPTQLPTAQLTQPPENRDTAEILKEMGGYPCSDDSSFTCIKVSVPLDHFNSKPDPTINVVFAVLPATSKPKGMFVTVIGGPGGSGLASADSYTSAFDPSITESFDIVFFDQRGVGASGNLQCAQAATDFYRADWRATTPTEEANLLNVAKIFSDDCVKQMGDTPLLPYLGTDQAVRDLEAFRQTIQDHGSATAEKIWLYGESYGTQFAQTYAAAFPQHLAALILDGTVDLTVTGLDYYREQVQAFYDVLESTLKTCTADEICFKDMGGDAVAAYDKLASAVSKQPRKYKFPLATGKTQERALTLADLESAASGYLYSETPRMIFLRALAAANTHNDLIPMARVLYDSLYMDPETLQAIPDPTYSDAVYYGVECNDYYYPGESAQAAAETYLRAGDEVDKNLPHFASLFYGDIPCPFWPVRTKNPDRPLPLVANGIPTLVLGATADVATPVNQGKHVFSRLADGYLVNVQGGAHVVYGRGDACVDDIVTAFLVKDQLPVQRETVCQGVMYDPYVTIAAIDAKVYANPLDALEAVDNEINFLPQYYDWDWETPTSIGCSFGGVLSFEASDSGANFKLQNCAFSKGFILSGTGTYDNESQVLTLEVSASGLAKGILSYIHDVDGSLSVIGDYAGKPVELKK